MKLIRRLCALLLAVLLMLTVAGCSSEPSSNTPDTPSESSSSQTEESSSESEELPSEGDPGSVPGTPADSSSSSQAAQPTLTFQGETVLEAAVLDYDDHFTADCLLSLLEPVMDELVKAAEVNDDSGSRAILLFTDKGRHSVWESAYNAQTEKNLHWYTHMTTAKITRIRLSGFESGIDTSDPAVIARISDYLKHGLTATPTKTPEVDDGAMNPDMPSSLYSVEVWFDSGVRYRGHGYGDYGATPDPGGSIYYLYSSDLDHTITYTLSEGSAAKLRQFMATFPQET